MALRSVKYNTSEDEVVRCIAWTFTTAVLVITLHDLQKLCMGTHMHEYCTRSGKGHLLASADETPLIQIAWD